MKQVGLTLGLSLILSSGSAAAQSISEHQINELNLYLNADIVAAGHELYSNNCAVCHGSNLEGQENWRKPDENGLSKAPPHDETGHTWHHADQQNFLITKYGMSKLVGRGYESGMPGFEGVLADAEILAILAFIKSQWPIQVVETHNQINAGAGH